MALDWLLGPKELRAAQNEEITEIRSLVVEPDTVREIYAMVEKATGGARLRPINMGDGGAQPPDVPIDELETVADWIRRSLNLSDATGFFTFSMHQGIPPTIVVSGGRADPPPANSGFTDWFELYIDLKRRVVQKLYAEGKPRLSWAIFAPGVPWAVWLILVATWIWYLIAHRPASALIVFGSLLTLAAAVSAYSAAIYVRGAMGNRHIGLSIRSMSREDIRRRRADRHANLRVAAVTIPAGAIVGGLVTALFR